MKHYDIQISVIGTKQVGKTTLIQKLLGQPLDFVNKIGKDNNNIQESFEGTFFLHEKESKYTLRYNEIHTDRLPSIKLLPQLLVSDMMTIAAFELGSQHAREHVFKLLTTLPKTQRDIILVGLKSDRIEEQGSDDEEVTDLFRQSTSNWRQQFEVSVFKNNQSLDLLQQFINQRIEQKLGPMTMEHLFESNVIANVHSNL